MGKEPTTTEPPDQYADLLSDIKSLIHGARLQAALAVNRELVLLYWHIVRDILTRQHAEGWGAKVIDRLAQDLRRSYPDLTPDCLARAVPAGTYLTKSTAATLFRIGVDGLTLYLGRKAILGGTQAGETLHANAQSKS